MEPLLRLKRHQVDSASRVLARAFEHDPVCVAFFPDASKRVLHNYHLMRHSIRYNMRYGKVYITSPRLEGVALWQLEASLKEQEQEQAQQDKFRRLYLNWVNFGSWVGLGKGLERVKSLYEHVFSTHAELVPMRHWYCKTIGVDPNFQGQGFGSRLLTPMLARIDMEQLPCYLDTNTEENKGLYERFGFTVVKRYSIPGSDVINWSMVRETQG